MLHTLPESHLELLQAILMELIRQRDGDAEFATPDVPIELPPAERVIGQ